MASYLDIPEEAVGVEGPFEAYIKVPLGQLRLRLVELILGLIQVNNTGINRALAESDIFRKISDLVRLFPWNNFLQLTVIEIYQDILDGAQEDSLFRHAVL